MADFTDKVVLITGASSGIGAVIAEAFSKNGASLSLTGRDVTRLEKTSQKCMENGTTSDKILLTPCDLSEPASVDLLIETTVERFGQIDVLVNNAGFGAMKPFDTVMMEQMDEEYHILLRAPFFLSQKALPYLKQTKGCIINISSAASSICLPGESTYAAFKAALDHVTRIIALEGASSGVRVNSINPGVVKTPILGMGVNPDELAECLETYGNLTPLGRVAEASEIASTTVFLASPPASFITGINLTQDGGACLATPWAEALK